MIFKELNGKTIARVERLSKDACDVMMWHKKPVAIIFTDNSYMIPICDDECNDGGSILYHNDNEDKSTIIYTD